MERRRMGDSDLMCFPLGFGCWEMGGAEWGPIDTQEAIRTVNAAVDSGINLFDTAEVYGPFTSEEMLGRALGSRRKDVIVVTKVGYAYNEQGQHTVHDCSRASILKRSEGCLKRLGTDYVDLLLIHWPDHKTPHEETIGALEELKAAGKIRYYGVANYNVPMVEACQRYGHITTNQVGYNLFDRRAEPAVLPYCRAHQVGFMSYSTLGYGLLTGGLKPDSKFAAADWRNPDVSLGIGIPLFQRDHYLMELRVTERLKALAAGYGRTVAQLAIAWVLGEPAVSVALTGMRNRAELADNVQAVGWKLTAEDRAEIERIFTEEGCPTFSNVPISLH